MWVVMNNVLNRVNQVKAVFDDNDVELTARRALDTIQIAKEKMKSGELSAEAFLGLKDLVLIAVQPANDWVN